MRQLPLATAVVISLVMSACSFFAGQEDDTSAPIVQPAAPLTFSSPIVPAKPKTRVAALIQPTNPDERLRAIKSGRADPFAALVPRGSGGQTAAGGSANSGRTKAATANTMTRTGSSGRPTGSTASSALRSFARPRSTSGSQPSRSGLPGPSPSSQENGSPQSVPSLPPLPQPELAQGVQVSGIALVNGEPRAIVKAPDETVSRSVTAGDRLSNGQVLVKRIEISSAEPVVILEQYGTEVAVGVGTGV